MKKLSGPQQFVVDALKRGSLLVFSPSRREYSLRAANGYHQHSVGRPTVVALRKLDVVLPPVVESVGGLSLHVYHLNPRLRYS